MGLFYIDNSDQNSVSSHRNHLKEISDLTKETLKIAELADPSIFPEFLWEVQSNDYEGDDYKLRGTCENPNVLKAYTIRRKYSNYWDYLDAMEAYIDYAEYVESAYGSFQMMKNAADNGMSPIYIPKKPKLTNKKANKNLIKAGFVPSRFDDELIVDQDVFDAALYSIESKDISTEDDGYELPKNIAKLHSKEGYDRVKSSRIGSIYATNNNGMQGMDAIINFLNNPNKDSLEERSRKDSSFTDEMRSIDEFSHLPQAIIDDMFSPKTAFISSSFLMNPEKQAQQVILSALTEAGFNFLDKSATSGMDKEVVRAVTRKYGAAAQQYEDLTPKQIKKLKKKEAKRRRRSKERLIGDRRLQDALLRNRAHFSRDDNLNFRLCDVIPEDD